MTEQNAGPGRRRRRSLTAEQKFQLWLEVLTGQATRYEAARKWGVDRSTVVRVSKTAKEAALAALRAARPGRPQGSGPDAELAEAREEIARLAETVKEQAIELVMSRGKQRGAW